MLNIAHRGFKGRYPENTMIAFKKALEAGADGIEFDVHLTKDKRVVIIHDESLDRTTDKKGLIKDKTYEEIKKANAGALYEGCFQSILSLEEYFEAFRDEDIITNIEIKNSIIDYEGIESLVYDIVCAYDMKDRVIVSSFNHKSLLRMKNIDPDIKCGALESSRLVRPWDYVKDLGLEYFHPMNFTVDDKMLKKFKEYGLGLNIWFALSDYDFSLYKKEGVTGLITDFPDRL